MSHEVCVSFGVLHHDNALHVHVLCHYNSHASCFFCVSVAFDVVCENLSSPSFEHAVGAHDSDIAFLSEFMNSALMQSLVRVGCFSSICGLRLLVIGIFGLRMKMQDSVSA